MKPFSDPNAVPFAYATSHSGIAVRYPGVVELTFLSERFLQSRLDEEPSSELVVCARLAMPIDRAADFAAALSQALSQHGEAEPSNDEGIRRGKLAAGVLVTALKMIADRLFSHLDPSQDREALLDKIEEDTIRSIKNVTIEGADMAHEAPAIETAVQLIGDIIEEWRSTPS
jgi:hypothetical protein